MLSIRIDGGEISVDGALNDTDCARALARALPLTTDFQVWGDELHLDVPIEDSPRQSPARVVSVGDLGFWPDDGTLCIFCGPTPLSTAEEPVSAIPVTIVGRIDGAEALRAGKDIGRITISTETDDVDG